MSLFIVIVIYFKIIPTLCGGSGGDIYMMSNQDNTQKWGRGLSTGVEGSWRVGQQFLFLMNECVVKIDLLANRLTRWPRTPICWPTGRPVDQHLIIGGWVITFFLLLLLALRIAISYTCTIIPIGSTGVL